MCTFHDWQSDLKFKSKNGYILMFVFEPADNVLRCLATGTDRWRIGFLQKPIPQRAVESSKSQLADRTDRQFHCLFIG